MKIIIIILAGIIFLFYQNERNNFADSENNYEDQITEDNFKAKIEDKFSNVKEVHFTHRPITYSMDINTSEYYLGARLTYRRPSQTTDEIKRNRIRAAFNIIENSTGSPLTFKEVNESENPDIKIFGIPEIYCYDDLNRLNSTQIVNYETTTLIFVYNEIGNMMNITGSQNGEFTYNSGKAHAPSRVVYY